MTVWKSHETLQGKHTFISADAAVRIAGSGELSADACSGRKVVTFVQRDTGLCDPQANSIGSEERL